MQFKRKLINDNSHKRKISRRCTSRYLQCTANMERCNHNKQYIQELLQVYKKEDKSVLFTNDLKAATECNVAFVILR